ncbi:hypothetical protein LYSHEL_24710 [Lysobacter helvus]|uniref:DUF3857 domain-containing protein n=2 Tax=Lysobacteraceae TaxID=32033 RepID=A0ABN6FUR7_9GAMM|nr:MULTISPECIES: DUF3857 domain-containing protein [Lysobacter]BCT93447.1 hypothetical protein LYSCAS_24710 [Lysobacter caseinilyticus]BCT96600.1 hypothetical protein LYSHEL_24710 [Lysobacter helvus]
MNLRASLAILLLACLLIASPSFAATPHTLTPTPAWVHLAPMPAAADAAPTSDGTRYLLLDDQVDTTQAQPVWYRRFATRMDGPRALAEGGQVSIAFQPDYQRVELHTLDVWRDGQRIDHRRDAQLQVLRREEDLDSGIFDGENTLSITVPDVRVGDIVDVSFSTVGANPVFGRAYFDSYRARFSTALGYRRVRARFDADAPLFARAPTTDYTRKEGEEGGHRYVEFVAHRLHRVAAEDDMPSSFDPWGRIDLSTARTWSDIVAWALPMYRPHFSDRALAQKLVHDLRLDDKDPRAAMMRAIAFVEGQIRYTALDMGKNSHEPNAPETVIARRFGDCKDKSLLLSALLAEAGIRAEPVLVDTEARRSLAGRQPSATVFDHVVVRAHLGDQVVWIDPTRDPEADALADRTPLPFELGLPICEGCDKLVAIPQPLPRRPEVDVGQRIALHEDDKGYRADFVVVSDYRNEKADDVRDDFADGAEDPATRYLTYMRRYYAGLRSAGTPSLRERDASVGAVRTTERYSLHWPASQGADFDIVLFQLIDWLPDLDLDVRTMPLALEGPRSGRQVVRTHLGSGWDIPASDDTVANAYFTFHRTVRVVGDTLEIVGEWKRLAAEVPPADYARVRDDVDRIQALMRYSVEIGAEAADAADAPGNPWNNAAPWRWIALALLLTTFLLAVVVRRQGTQLRRHASAWRSPRTPSPESRP